MLLVGKTEMCARRLSPKTSSLDARLKRITSADVSICLDLSFSRRASSIAGRPGGKFTVAPQVNGSRGTLEL